MSIQPFETTNTGNCPSCNIIKPLDMMVRKSYLKNMYECIDCKVDEENKTNNNFKDYDHIKIIEQVLNGEDVSTSKLKSLIRWCFG